MSSADHFKPMPRKNTGGLFGFIKYHLANIFFGNEVHNYNEDERVKGFQPRGADAFGYELSENQASEEKIKQKRLIKASDKLLSSAWGVEIVAALIGVAVAVAIGYTIHNDAGDSVDSDVWINIVLGSLPFIMVAIVEISKIPLARVVYNAESLLKTVFFSIILAAAIVVTWETMVTGMERSIAGQMAKVSKPMLKKEELRLKLESKKGLNGHYIQSYMSSISTLKAEKDSEEVNQNKWKADKGFNKFVLFETPIASKETEAKRLRVEKKSRKEELRNLKIEGIEQLSSKLKVSSVQLDKHAELVAKATQKIQIKDKTIKAEELDLNTNYGSLPCNDMSYNWSDLKCMEAVEKDAWRSQLAVDKKSLSTMISKRDELELNPPKTDNNEFNKQQEEISKKYNFEVDNKFIELEASLVKVNSELEGFKIKLAEARNEKATENNSLKENIEASMEAQKKIDTEIKKLEDKIKDLKEGNKLVEIEDVKNEINELDTQINDAASKINMYRMAYPWYKKFEFIQITKEDLDQLKEDAKTDLKKLSKLEDYNKNLKIAEERGTLNSFIEKSKVEYNNLKEDAKTSSEKKQELRIYEESLIAFNAGKSGALLYSQVPPKFVMGFAHTWFAILATVVSIVGTVMAFGSFLLRDYHTRTRSGLVEDLKCIWRFITGEEDCRRQPDSANVSRGRATHPNSRGVNLDENIQYIREAVFIPYLTTDPSIVNAPLQAVADKVEEQDVPNTDTDTLTDEDSAASNSDDNTDK